MLEIVPIVAAALGFSFGCGAWGGFWVGKRHEQVTFRKEREKNNSILKAVLRDKQCPAA